MVGADQSIDIMRKQGITRVPASRFHFLSDVAESVIDYMVKGNTFELAQAQAGHPMYPNAYFSHLGTRQRYNAEMIFFHNNTDHMTFNEAPVGIPGVTFTNMPDRFIHSADDDLETLDRTQLGRNAVSAALIAYTMASADNSRAASIAAETSGRGAERIGNNVRLALTMISANPADATYFQAIDQVRYAAERERKAAASITQIDPAAAPLAASLAQAVDQREAQALKEVDSYYRTVTRRASPRNRALSEAEKSLAALHPSISGGPREFLTGRSKIASVEGLHGLMAFEVLNYIDGRRSGLDIYRAVAAEAREGGDYYYGTVTPEGVLAYLKNATTSGLVRGGS
jgi:hypothetical protein